METIDSAKRSLDEFVACVERSRSRADLTAQLAGIYRDFRRALEKTLLPDGATLDNELRKGAQSKQFMMQIVPHIQSFMRRYDRGRVFEVLDVGCGTAHGSNLLASLYQTVELGYRARVTALDIDSAYHDYTKFFCPYIVHKVVGDISEINRRFDIVVASHVVEHVEEPERFVENLKRMASDLLIVCAPYRENPELLTSGHLNIIDDEMIASFQPTSVEFIESPAWGQFMEPRYKMFIATFENRGQIAEKDGTR